MHTKQLTLVLIWLLAVLTIYGIAGEMTSILLAPPPLEEPS